MSKKEMNIENEENCSLDFSGLILGFSSAALYELGETTLDNHRVQKPNLELAMQNIDIIRLLEEKTKGNLSEAESNLIENVLKDLDSKYAEIKLRKK